MTSDIQASPLSLAMPTAMSKLSVEACLHACHKLTQVPILSRYHPPLKFTPIPTSISSQTKAPSHHRTPN